MSLLAIVLAPFLLAPVAPWLHRALVGGRAADGHGDDGHGNHHPRPALTGWLLAIVPAAIAVALGYLAFGAADRLDGAAAGGAFRLESHPWVDGLGVAASFRLDGLSLLMALLVSGIGSLILVYAGSYLAGHPQLGRLYAYLLLFMGSMLGVVLADNLLLLFVFWELTSVSSYLLIGFDHAREKARKSALAALLVTGSGGLAILAAVILVGIAAGTLELSALIADRGAALAQSPLLTPIIVLFVLGACTKSAQFPFHFWLPAAMEAPTPVSAYLHSSTMVKAGVYLLARLAPILGAHELWTQMLLLFGGATMVVGAWLAFRQTKMKPLLAYTTVSSLGSLVFAIGVGTASAFEAAMVFLLAHAFYKGALFMIAGAIDHATGEKDLAKLGGLRSAMPILFGATLLAALSMAGIPPFLGFIAKELLLDSVFAATESGRFGPLPIAAAILAASLMVAVIARFVVRAYFGPRQTTPQEPHEPPAGQLLGPVLLATLGLLAALLPALVALPVLQPASAAILQATTAPDLGLWHGLKPALIASIAALAIGTGLFLGERIVLRAAEPFARLDAIGPAAAYQGILAGVLGFASLQTRLLQSGYLRRYLFWTSLVTVAAVAGTFAARAKLTDLLPGGRTPLELLAEARFYEVGLVVLIIVGALFTAAARTRLAAIGGLGLVGYGVALVFVLFGAPDLAITQLSVETLTVVLLVLVFRFLPDLRTISDSRRRVRDLAIAATGGVMMAGLVLLATTTSLDRHVSQYFAQTSLPEAYGRNVVNVILVDFRGTDTLGEITVLAVAAVGVYTLLKMSPWSKPRRRESEQEDAR